MVEIFQTRSGSINALTVTVPAEEISRLIDQFGRRLVNQNVRYYLEPSTINKRISKTLRTPTEKRYFWRYNNGITMTCNRIVHRSNKTISIRAPQIINGCQTAWAIHEYANETGANLQDVAVMLRIIQTKNSDVQLKITANTNTQNPQSNRNLCANYESQINLAELFKRMAKPVFYERKDGEWESLPDSQKSRFLETENIYRRIDNVKVAQAFAAFSFDDPDTTEARLNPTEARRNPKTLFDVTLKKYTRIFPDNPDSTEVYLVPALLMKYVESRLRQKAKELSDAEKKWDDLDDSQKDVWEARRALRYSKIHMVGVLGWVIKRKYKKYINEVAEKLLDSIGDFAGPHGLADSLIDFASKVVEDFALMQVQNNREEYDPAILFRRGETWTKLKSTAELRYGRESIASLLP